MQKLLVRLRIILDAMSPDAELERLILARAVLTYGSLGLFRKSRFGAALDARILRAPPRAVSESYRDWLRRYHWESAPSPEAPAGTKPPVVVLYASGASLARLARCLRSLRRQDRAFENVILLAPSAGQKLAVGMASALAGVRVEISDYDRLAGRLSGDVLLLKGAPILRPRALGVLASALAARRGALAAYADEDRMSWSGPCLPFFKPDHSPVLGRQYDYAGNVALFARDFFVRDVLPDLGDGGLPRWIGDPRIERGALVHVPQILHAEPGRRRISYVSGGEFDRALAEGARSRPLPRVGIVIPTKDRAPLLRNCIDSIFDVTDFGGGEVSIVIVDNGSTEPDALLLLETLGTRPAITILHQPGAFNYARLCNLGAKAAAVDVLIFLNNDIVIRDKDWIAKLAGAGALPATGVVGCKLLYPSGRVQHAGVVLGIQGLAGHAGVGAAEHDGVYFNLANQTREISAVTGALIAIGAELFRRCGGYDEQLAVTFNDTTLCLACNRLGYQSLYLQSALAFHMEGASRGRDDDDPATMARLITECHYVLSKNSGFKSDPFYNVNLSLLHAYEIAKPPRLLCRPRALQANPLVLVLSSTFQFGHGVAVVVDILSRFLEQEGLTVFIGAPRTPTDLAWPEERRFGVRDVSAAAQLAVEVDADVVIAHTPPFFSVFKILPPEIVGIAHDHGEPPPGLFPDALSRHLVNAEKQLSMRYADRVFAISESVRVESGVPGCVILPNGNTHLTGWREASAERRRAARVTRGWEGQLVILNVCRFHEAERFYKGIDVYIDLRQAVAEQHPQVAAMTRFVLAGKGDGPDVAFVARRGIDVIANPSDAELADLYHAGDLYMNFSRWEGYNLGLGQALAIGLPSVASDIPAHRAFGIPVAATLTEAVAEVVRAFDDPARGEILRARTPVLREWAATGAQLRAEIDELTAARRRHGVPAAAAAPPSETAARARHAAPAPL